MPNHCVLDLKGRANKTRIQNKSEHLIYPLILLNSIYLTSTNYQTDCIKIIQVAEMNHALIKNQ